MTNPIDGFTNSHIGINICFYPHSSTDCDPSCMKMSGTSALVKVDRRYQSFIANSSSVVLKWSFNALTNAFLFLPEQEQLGTPK